MTGELNLTIYPVDKYGFNSWLYFCYISNIKQKFKL